MADDPFDFLSPDGPVVEEPVIPPAITDPAIPPTEPPVEPVAEPPAAEPPVAPPEPAPAAPPATAPVIAPVPLEALLSEREKRQAAEKELAELRKQAAPVKQPTVTDDPEGWQAAQDARFEKFRLDQTMEMSGRYAAQHFGRDKVQAAMAWGKEQAGSDPYFGPKFTAQPDPFGWLVEQHRKASALGLLGDKTPEEWAIEYAASQGYAKPSGEPPATQQPAVAAAPVQPTPPTAPPKSIAGATPAGGSSTPVTLQEQEVAEFWSR